MGDTYTLLDTPKKLSLQQRSTELRGALKDFERKFAEENGRKPKQFDIKENAAIAVKYKDYHKVQDVLSGKLSFEEYSLPGVTTKVRSRRHTRTDSGIGSDITGQRSSLQSTPRKAARPENPGFNGASVTNSPHLPLINAIGPTPHRDGKILGLFDLLSDSSRAGSQSTPSSARKRKIEELYEATPIKRQPLQVIQTPSQRSSRKARDLLDFLAGTPQKTSEPDAKRHSRTPQSEGRKFHLSQFFATPMTQRFLFSSVEAESTRGDHLGQTVPSDTPARQPDNRGLDTTPQYLRRSTSFKDRLLSASSAPKHDKIVRSSSLIGPPTLRHFRSSTSNVLTTMDIHRQTAGTQGPRYEDRDEDEDDYEDDLAALRDMEDQDDQPGSRVSRKFGSDGSESAKNTPADEQQPAKPYKKKGQKRTTKKANIKPATFKSKSKPAAGPKFVAADESDPDSGSEAGYDGAGRQFLDEDDDDDNDVNDDYVSNGSDDENGTLPKKNTDRKVRGDVKSTGTKKTNVKRKAGTIDPNAQSHMNFRSLKIKNKNSKAKGMGRGRFGRGRR